MPKKTVSIPLFELSATVFEHLDDIVGGDFSYAGEFIIKDSTGECASFVCVDDVRDKKGRLVVSDDDMAFAHWANTPLDFLT